MPCPHRAAAALGFLPLFLGILIPEACGGRLPEPNELSAKRAVTVGYGLVLSERTDTTVASSQAQLLAGMQQLSGLGSTPSASTSTFRTRSGSSSFWRTHAGNSPYTMSTVLHTSSTLRRPALASRQNTAGLSWCR